MAGKIADRSRGKAHAFRLPLLPSLMARGMIGCMGFAKFANEICGSLLFIPRAPAVGRETARGRRGSQPAIRPHPRSHGRVAGKYSGCSSL
jgi:hypothetical protein